MCVYVDDWMGRATAHESRLVCLSTLELIACLVRLGRLGRDEAERIVSDLLGSNPTEDPDYLSPLDPQTSSPSTTSSSTVYQPPAPTNHAMAACARTISTIMTLIIERIFFATLFPAGCLLLRSRLDCLCA